MATILTAFVDSGGTGYSVGNALAVLSGNGDGILSVTSVSSGVVTGVSITTPGTGYSAELDVATTAAPVGGTGCTVKIATSIFDYEGTKSRIYRRASGRGWTRKRDIWPIPDSVVDTLLPSEWTAYPGESGKHAAVLIDSQVDVDHTPRNTDAGGMVSRVSLFYRERTPEEWLLANPNKFIIERGGAGYCSAVDSTKTVTPTGSVSSTVTSTSTRTYANRPIFRVYGYTNNLATYATPYVGKAYAVNSDTLTKFGTWNPIGSLMLLHFSCKPAVSGSSLYQINWVLTGKFLPYQTISHATRDVRMFDNTLPDGTVDANARKVRVPTYHGYSNSTTGAYATTVAMLPFNNVITDW